MFVHIQKGGTRQKRGRRNNTLGQDAITEEMKSAEIKAMDAFVLSTQGSAVCVSSLRVCCVCVRVCVCACVCGVCLVFVLYVYVSTVTTVSLQVAINLMTWNLQARRT